MDNNIDVKCNLFIVNLDYIVCGNMSICDFRGLNPAKVNIVKTVPGYVKTSHFLGHAMA